MKYKIICMPSRPRASSLEVIGFTYATAIAETRYNNQGISGLERLVNTNRESINNEGLIGAITKNECDLPELLSTVQRLINLQSEISECKSLIKKHDPTNGALGDDPVDVINITPDDIAEIHLKIAESQELINKLAKKL